MQYEEYTKKLKYFLELRKGLKIVVRGSYNQVRYSSFRIRTVKYVLGNTKKID